MSAGSISPFLLWGFQSTSICCISHPAFPSSADEDGLVLAGQQLGAHCIPLLQPFPGSLCRAAEHFLVPLPCFNMRTVPPHSGSLSFFISHSFLKFGGRKERKKLSLNWSMVGKSVTLQDLTQGMCFLIAFPLLATTAFPFLWLGQTFEYN